ncbi:MAG: restriction endonuclease [Clostridia bacterium]|nr:restriction endonuclease [Clostridia bacterium]
MGRQKKSKLLNDVEDFFYSLPILLAYWVYQETGSQWLAALVFILSLGLLYLGISKYKQWKRRKLLKSGIDIVDSMTGAVFEEYILEHFKHIGYTGRLIANTDDSGADMLLQKGNEKVAVQVKRWKNNVGVDAVQQVIGAVEHYAADKGIVVTNSSFTESAHELAASGNVELWDRKKLIELIDSVNNVETKEAVLH